MLLIRSEDHSPNRNMTITHEVAKLFGYDRVQKTIGGVATHINSHPKVKTSLITNLTDEKIMLVLL